MCYAVTQRGDCMIEVVYKEEKKEAVGNEKYFHIPKNIRQIGEVDDNYKIYIEDYAYHYLDRMSDEVSGGKIALLMGQTNWSEGTAYVFIKSAFRLKDMEADQDHIVFNEEIWNEATETMETYFPQQDVVGWFFTMPESTMQITESIYRAHLNYFAGNDKVFFMKEPMDREEAFYRYENGKMSKQSGYYLYYERNEAMQEFLIAEGENKPMESGELVNDKAVKDFRDIITQKKEQKENKTEKKTPYFMYASSAAAIIIALALGTTYINDYQKMKDVQGTAEEIASQVSETAADTGDTISHVYEVARDKSDSAQANSSLTEAVTGTPEAKTSLTATETPEPTETPGPTESPEPNTVESPQEKETPPASELTDKESDDAAANTEPKAYEIQPGDTLTSISKAIYGDISMIDSICQLNSISGDTVIYPGEMILLPE